ncbi:MAG TPA: hypothetical protein VGG45_12580 [Terracidiphilus sp.]
MQLFRRRRISTLAGFALAIGTVLSLAPGKPLRAAAAGASSVPVYIVLRGQDRSKITQIASCPQVSGITLYYGWSSIEPKPGVYDFSQVLANVDQAIAAGKKVNIALLPGRWSPAHVLNKASSIRWEQRDMYVENNAGSQANAPVPWDPAFESSFTNAIAAFGKALSGRNINSVAITGGSNTNGIEMNLHATDAELRRIGFTPQKYIQAWELYIDAYAKAFPNQVLTLAVHNQIGDSRNNEIPTQILDYARHALGSRFYPTSFAFTGESWFQSGDPYVNLLLQHREGSHFGLQAIQVYSAKNDAAGFKNMIDKAAQFNPAWLEIWPKDLQAGYWSCK